MGIEPFNEPNHEPAVYLFPDIRRSDLQIQTLSSASPVKLVADKIWKTMLAHLKHHLRCFGVGRQLDLNVSLEASAEAVLEVLSRP